MSVDSCVDFRPDDAGRIDARTANAALSLNSLEQRHRPVAIPSVLMSISRMHRRPQRIKVLKEVDKFNLLIVEKGGPSFKSRSLKLVLLTIVCGMILTLIYAPTVYNDRQPRSSSRYVAVLTARIKCTPTQISQLFNSTAPKKSVTWAKLYPEWIDEEEETKIPACPSLPEPEFRSGSQFDLIAVKLPCSKPGSWSRDVARLHLQLSAAKVAVASSRSTSPVHVLVVTDCFPIPNLFSCKYLARREGNAWLYKPDLSSLREKLRLPVGSCELAVPLKAKARLYSVRRRREAYATILHSADAYVCGAIAAAQSIRQAGSRRDLVILVDESISGEHRAGWSPPAGSKFRLWQLTDYDKVVFVDADLLVLRSVDFLFAAPEISATGNNASLFNSGVMVIEPSNCTFGLLMEHVHEITSYNGGDQGYLNEIFAWCIGFEAHELPEALLGGRQRGREGAEDAAVRCGAAGALRAPLPGEEAVAVLPRLRLQLECGYIQAVCERRRAREVVESARRNAGESAEVLLSEHAQKAALEWDRRQAEQANFSDGHWRRTIRDPRRGVCVEKFCSWESMLLHWGETNWTGASTVQVQVQVQANPSL
uniref:Hexosyltransferase n=1 Tax=Ananas comosus var. bracteatus TaxID=296719 RepID=A0A6V7Q6H5_ANACO|nr:unnamed protein product [Ananas comosus var. bracteatus]